MIDPVEAYNNCYRGKLTRAQAEKIIESATAGNPALAAYYMHRDCRSNQSWAEGVIEKVTIGNTAEVAYWMALYCGSDREWAEYVIENATVGDPAKAAYRMVRYCGSDERWAEEIKEAWARGVRPHEHEWIPWIRRDGTRRVICSICDREKK